MYDSVSIGWAITSDAYARTRTYDTYHTPLNLSRRLSFPVQAGLNGLREDPVNDPRPEGGRISVSCYSSDVGLFAIHHTPFFEGVSILRA